MSKNRCVHWNAYPLSSLRIHSIYPSGCVLYTSMFWFTLQCGICMFCVPFTDMRDTYTTSILYKPWQMKMFFTLYVCFSYIVKCYIATSNIVHWDLVFCYALVVWPSFIQVFISVVRVPWRQYDVIEGLVMM